MPRIDPETGYGIVTDVCLKRKIRNYVEAVKEGSEGYDIFIKSGVPLNRSENEAFQSVGIDGAAEMKSDELKKKVKALKETGTDVDTRVREFLCEKYYDIRTFGAVLTTCVQGALNCGQVRGPVQLSFARSIDSVIPQELTITRTAITKESDAENKSTEMGKKYVVPYGLYRAEGYVSANLARKVTGFSEDDLQILWQAILNMFECDHSAARGKMAVRELIVFKHDSELGNAPAYKLFDAVTVKRRDEQKPARAYSDYEVQIDETKIPVGVTLRRMG